MTVNKKSIYIGNNQLLLNDEVKGTYDTIHNELYYKIAHVDKMPPFFMSLVSASNHWMFIASNGGLTAGRKNADNSLFPYYTDDKITASADSTGSKTIFLVKNEAHFKLWEPFSNQFKGIYQTQRNLYKNTLGNKIIFEEFNADLQLTYRYHWNFSDQFGFVKIAELINHNAKAIDLSLLDGIQNILPCGISSALQNDKSNLVNAYKKNELMADTGLGIVMLSAVIVDKPEPSVALKANTIWSYGLENTKKLICSDQLESFRNGFEVEQELDVRARNGAYFLHSNLQLQSEEIKQWIVVAEVNQDMMAIAQIQQFIKKEHEIFKIVLEDVQKGTDELTKLIANADGLQCTEDKMINKRHISNTLFNIMRGGIFDDNFLIDSTDFIGYIAKSNKKLAANQTSFFTQLPSVISFQNLLDIVLSTKSVDIIRLTLSYLPLKFSRRHGDPSRPWNRFSIETKDASGKKMLNYEGNWRDIFQNWEALAYSYPLFLEGMITKFINSSTFEGYNPYRINKNGFDWETIEPDDPWSFIGYWGDHQIIYLLKLLELLHQYQPQKLVDLSSKEWFVYANVPYKIKSYADILKNPKDTIEFDTDLDRQLRTDLVNFGADAALLKNRLNEFHYVNLIEKLLVAGLAKLTNFIPQAGIWLNTQRPEWNDANNALVGNGCSMVTLYYLRRYLVFCNSILKSTQEFIAISEEVAAMFESVYAHFKAHESLLKTSFNDIERKNFIDVLGALHEKYRSDIYQNKFSGVSKLINKDQILAFTQLSIQFIDQTIKFNKRSDNLYHAYNLIHFKDDNAVNITHLYEMLEGQVAVLSSGYLATDEVLQILNGLRNSELYRQNQQSYLLYPDRQLSRFTQKNCINKTLVEKSNLLTTLIADSNKDLIEVDIDGNFHFNADFNNQSSVLNALNKLAINGYKPLVELDKNLVLAIFEDTFKHRYFTGRSGTFYGYEGLGSIYWHMVSKLLVAVQECFWSAVDGNENQQHINQLAAHYYGIREGIGMYKSPEKYGAFPTDPYSHTPENSGVKQPGMTGQVKEDLISRWGELGIRIKDGKLTFNPTLLRKNEFLTHEQTFEMYNIYQQKQQIALEKRQLCFSFCQVPIIYQLSNQNCIHWVDNNQNIKIITGLSLNNNQSNELFSRSGSINKLLIEFDEKIFFSKKHF